MGTFPRHVWVDVTGSWADPQPGVLIDWRRDRRGGWEAWVIRAWSYSTGGGVEAQVMASWVPGHLIRPADAPRPVRDLSAYRKPGPRA